MNMRTGPGQEVLRKWLLEIGQGIHGEDSGMQGRTDKVLIPRENVARSLDEAIDFCFPAGLFQEPLKNAEAFSDNAILCPTNNDVRSINDLAMYKMQGDARVYNSVDEPLEPRDTFNDFRSDFNIETIHNEMPTGMPPHELVLKVVFVNY